MFMAPMMKSPTLKPALAGFGQQQVQAPDAGVQPLGGGPVIQAPKPAMSERIASPSIPMPEPVESGPMQATAMPKPQPSFPQLAPQSEGMVTNLNPGSPMPKPRPAKPQGA